MISASKSREIAKRAQFNLYDSQLRLLFEEISLAAKAGNMSFTIHSWDCKNTFFEESFWFSGAKQNSNEWQKIVKTLCDLGYGVNYTLVKFGDERITVSW